MKLYKEDKKTIVLAQGRDPLMDHLSSKIIAFLPPGEGLKILDIGCGVGRIAKRAALMGFEVFGVDIERTVINIARENLSENGLEKRCHFLAGDILKIKKLSQMKFDVVICSEVIEHVKNPQKIVNLAYEKLENGGLLILTTPHNPKLWSVLDDYAQHQKRFTIEELRKLLVKFQIIRLFTIGFPFMRMIISAYGLFIKKVSFNHPPGWRKKTILNEIYYFVISLLLKFDDLFNFLNLGTNILVVAKKGLN